MKLDRRLSRASVSPLPRARSATRGGFRFWPVLSALGLLGSLGLLLFHRLAFTRSLDRLPADLTVAGVPVGGLTRAEAEERLRAVYLGPVRLDYRGSEIQLDPALLNFQLDTAAMLAQAPEFQSSGSVWRDFWAYLWNQALPAPSPIPLQVSYDTAALENFLREIGARYDNPGQPAVPDPATLKFIPGTAGYALDTPAALAQIDAALHSAANRRVSLPVSEYAQAPPTYEELARLLYADVRLFQFTGTVSLHLADLDTGETLELATHNQAPFAIGPGIAYSGMSTIKIPVMVTYFRFRDGELTPDEELLLGGVFEESANAYTDLLLGVIGGDGGLAGAGIVTDTMGALGLPNTYISGLLDTLGAVTGPRSTPANSRPDLNLAPDPYNQTTATDMGRLLVMIYQCSRGGGPLMETFPGEYTADECQTMIRFLAANAVGPIFIAGGVPEGMVVPHKHGWDLLPLNNVGDAALVFSPGGNYAVAVYAHRDEPVDFESANRLLISLGRAIYNYYNP